MKKEIVEKIKKTKWHGSWGGTTPLLDVSFAPELYFYGPDRMFGKGYTNIFVILKKGVAQGFLPEKEYEKLGVYLAKKLRTIESAKKWSKKFMQLTDEIFAVIELPPAKFFKKWENLKTLHGDFGAYAEATKTVFDILDEESSVDIKNILADARKYSETFYSKSSRAYSKLFTQLIIPKEYKKEDLLMMTRQELIGFIKNKKLPPVKVLRNRHECCGIYFSRAGIIFLDKKEVEKIENYWLGSEKHKKLSGVVAFKGRVIGRCRVILNFKGADMKRGDILVTGMTDPNYVPLMKKAGAIITDGGGLLSHAAIVARELKKPCIIGTKIATQVLKDGDLVEVDANMGIVRIINKKNEKR